MLDKLRDRAAQLLAKSHDCVLATTGPAGIQVSTTACVAQGTTLYLLIPNTSDHLFNLEVAPEVAVTTLHWRLHGTGMVAQAGSALFTPAQRQWHTLIKVMPTRLHIAIESGAAAYAETIDFDPEPS